MLFFLFYIVYLTHIIEMTFNTYMI